MSVKGDPGLFPIFGEYYDPGGGVMSWSIEYEGNGIPRKKRSSAGRRVLTVCFFLIFLLTICLFWPEGRNLLRMVFLPGDPDVTLEAAEVFADALRQGIPVSDAARQFCITVVSHEVSAGN